MRNIAELRSIHQLTPAQLAIKAGVTSRDIYNIEKFIPVSETIIGSVCSALSVPREDVLVASTNWREKRP